jgi:hypothetical protein
MEFQEFPKIPRWSREIVITEKIDGSNAQIFIATREEIENYGSLDVPHLISDLSLSCDLFMWAGSRSRYLTLKADNFGFAEWCVNHADDLFRLGPGRHFGEWWGSGIQRTYGLKEKRFSLFNRRRWGFLDNPLFLAAKDAGTVVGGPACCSVVPLLYQGPNEPGVVEAVLGTLKETGSRAAPGYKNPEGVVIFHSASGSIFKKTVEKDSEPKSK